MILCVGRIFFEITTLPNKDYIIVDDTDSDSNDSEVDCEDEAGVEIMESSTDQTF